MFRARAPRLAFVAIALGAACHHAPPPEVAAVAARPNADSIAAAQARARMEAAQRDSIARANAARRDAAARADADRRARESAEATASSAIAAKVFFDYDKAELQPEAIAALDAKVPVLRSHGAMRIRIDGNADDRGSNEYNMALGQRRAASAKRYLVANGIDASRIETASLGEERPVCQDDTEACWHQNRRDEFVISGNAVSSAQSRP